ncbi:MAG: dephospho-CoA kinase [Elusimicrobiales bacterium]|jgi:dephospho-CoA kinase
MNKEMTRVCREFGRLKGRTVVGLTGTIASGKSAALARFGELGAFCVSTDELAKEVLTLRVCYNKILRKFGSGVFLKDGSLDRTKLAKEVFSDKSKRKRLESILHPEILKRALALIKKSDEKMIIVEVPLLFEAGLEKVFALTVCVDAPYSRRLERAKARGWTAGEFRRRSAAQLAAGEKAARADIVIGNDGSLRELGSKVAWIYDFAGKLEKK